MSDTYKGESPAKKMARLTYWLKVHELIGDRFFRQKHIVLASREAGDVSVLRGLGVEPKNIIGIDREQSAVDAAAARYPNVRFVCGDAADVAIAERRHGASVASVFLDFCANVTPQVVATCINITQHCLSHGSVLGVAFLRGRETGSTRTRLGALRELEPVFRDRMKGLPECGAQYTDRDMYLAMEMARVSGLWRRGWGPLMAGEMHYQSTTSTSRGVPMMISVLQIYREKANANRLKFMRRYAQASEAMNEAQDFVYRFQFPDDVEIDDAMRATALNVEFNGRMSVSESEWHANSRSFEKMWSIVKPGRASALLNIAPGTIAAWKAHATRGTYERSA